MSLIVMIDPFCFLFRLLLVSIRIYSNYYIYTNYVLNVHAFKATFFRQ